jgi:hypothetical protein
VQVDEGVLCLFARESAANDVRNRINVELVLNGGNCMRRSMVPKSESMVLPLSGGSTSKLKMVLPLAAAMWSVTFINWLLVTSYWFLVADCELLVAGC